MAFAGKGRRGPNQKDSSRIISQLREVPARRNLYPQKEFKREWLDAMGGRTSKRKQKKRATHGNEVFEGEKGSWMHVGGKEAALNTGSAKTMLKYTSTPSEKFDRRAVGFLKILWESKRQKQRPGEWTKVYLHRGMETQGETCKIKKKELPVDSPLREWAARQSVETTGRLEKVVGPQKMKDNRH